MNADQRRLDADQRRQKLIFNGTLFMRYSDVKQAARFYAPLYALEQAFPHARRHAIAKILDWLLGALVVLALAVIIVPFAPQKALAVLDTNIFEIFVQESERLYGALFIVLAFRLLFFLLELFHHSYYLRGIRGALSERGLPQRTPQITFEAGMVVLQSRERDITESFLASPVGVKALARCGITEKTLREFSNLRKPNSVPADTEVTDDEFVELSHLANFVYRNDSFFKEFLFNQGVQETHFESAARWVEREERQKMQKERWWSRDNLGRIPGIGKDWAYGVTYLLERYGHDMRDDIRFQSVQEKSPAGKGEEGALEIILARRQEANAFLVGEEGSGTMEVVARLAKAIERGVVLPPLEYKHVFVLDTEAVIAAEKEKGKFESEFIRILDQAVKAGNIVLVFENFPVLLQSGRALESDVAALLDPYISSQSIQVVALSDPDRFHELIEPNTGLMRRFEVVYMTGSDEDATIRVLEDFAVELEAQEGVFITYPALLTITQSADRYFPSGVMPDKAVDLLVEIMPVLAQKGKTVLEKTDVLELVESKTGVPLSEVRGEEKEKLLNLEKILHERIVGQNEAVSAISEALRRARSGVRNPDRPMGSFLFLGPTGVGKTETTKVLADVFFGSEENIMRLDMSEYAGDDALDRLIGSFESGKQGTLTSLLREKQYGVLLLDEFEKTDTKVHDLFLQILDEGEFKDARGKKVNAQNVLIIATSNAGSAYIWEYFQKGENVAEHKDELINEIIKKGIFKPELLNRFDGIVLFHPLDKEKIKTIAKLMLGKFAKRLAEQGIGLVPTDALLEMLVQKGYDPEFGARPMNRAISEHVEQVIADKMIRGEIKRGMKIVLEEKDFR